MTNFCIDCKWYMIDSHIVACTRNITRRTCLVTGKELPEGVYLYCNRERYSDEEVCCSEDAKFFVQR